MARDGRPILKILFQNFINSFRPRQLKGDLMGEDHLGNKFYEISARAGQRKSRWFEPPGKRDINDPEDHGHELSSEWESWLRGRRKEPPTPEELKRNLAIIEMKKRNAALLDQKFGTGSKNLDHASLKQSADVAGRANFPIYEGEFESNAGIAPPKKK